MNALCSHLFLLIVSGLATSDPLRAGADEPVHFNDQIRPLLNAHCVKCHGGVKEAGNLLLLLRDSALKGGKSGLPAIVPGKPEQSEVIARITTQDQDDRMPKKAEPLKPDQIALLKRWIAEGAKWEEHWAYVPPKRNGRSIDTIVEARLAKEHLALAPAADRWTLARRTALDLTGLPPSPEDVEALVKDRAPNAYERWVDRLLASPAYGERWAAVWLDAARYADSKGYEKDGFRDMWRYRDWVVDAFNSDMPYDRFLTEQLAGDLLPSPTDEQIIATAFHRNTLANDEGGTDDEEYRTYAVIDRLNATFDAVQGTSIGCVQCHGHPYDPFVHREYYQLLAFFDNTADADREDEAPTRRFYARANSEKAALLEQRIAATQREVTGELKRTDNIGLFDAWLRELRPPENTPPPAEKKEEGLSKELREILAKDPSTWTSRERAQAERLFFFERNAPLTELYRALDKDQTALAALPACKLPIMKELAGAEARTTRVFHRGNWLDKEEPVAPITPRTLNPWHDDYPRNRLGLAKWLTNGENPLTARVQVNRVWEQLFGVGLVETLEDFGSHGDRPSYQELLDELAVRFQTDMRWSQKALLREIVLSRVYRQSAKVSPALAERDPSNRLLARGPRFRLTSEQLRDQALAVGGILSREMFGPPVMPYQPPGIWLTPYEGRDWLTATNGDGRRRALYTFVRRSATYPSSLTFDSPSREFCTVRRIRSNTPLQSLDLLNDPVFFEAAEGLGKRMKTEGGPDLESQLRRGLFLATQRPPRPEQIAVLKKLSARVGGNLALVANAILNLDEVLNKN